MTSQAPHVEVLLVEDSPIQVRLVEFAIRDLPLFRLMHVAADGTEALEYLRGEGSFAGRKLPDVILSDINMPRMNGLELLRVVKSDETLANIPFVVLTTSELEDDIMRAYQGGASTFISKPIDICGLEQILRHFAHYWQAAKSITPEIWQAILEQSGQVDPQSQHTVIEPRSIEVLLVEDSPTQAVLIRRTIEALREFRFLDTLEDGQQVIDYLRREGAYSKARRPHLILLDLNLPKKDGFQVLREIKEDPDLRTIVSVVLTGRDDPQDIVTCYNLRANTFLRKPVDVRGMYAILHRFAGYWADEATKLPPR